VISFVALIGPSSFLDTGGVPGACHKVGRRKASYELPEEVERCISQLVLPATIVLPGQE
jgi:hypothetical protein